MEPYYQNESCTIYNGDCLDVLSSLPDESVDLVYLDPPFNTGKNWTVVWEGEARTFADKWPDLAAYVGFIEERAREMRRVLKDTGSFYLHTDPHHWSHYLKVMLDGVFGIENFQNEIIWARRGGGVSKRASARRHDTILFYSKSNKWTWNRPYQPYSESYIKSHYNLRDENGRRYQTTSLTAPAHGGSSGQYEWKGKPPPSGRMWSYTREKMEDLEREGRIVYTATGMPRYKRYLDEMRGNPVGSVWDDIPPVNSQARERLGYPTQKPLALLERIISASSNLGDVVLDPYCGSGTSVAVACKLGRFAIGIDSSLKACEVATSRLVRIAPTLEAI